MKTILPDAPSALYRKQISNIAARMWRLTTETALHPLRNMTAFSKVQQDFNEAEKEAYLCCSVMDTASVENEDRADNATTAVMAEMVHLRNNASSLIEKEPNKQLEELHS